MHLLRYRTQTKRIFEQFTCADVSLTFLIPSQKSYKFSIRSQVLTRVKHFLAITKSSQRC